MAIREVPRSFVYTCDGCHVEHTQENAGGHYTNSRPPRWSTIVVGRDALDYHGVPVADGTVKLLLCERCSDAATSAMNAALAAMLPASPSTEARG